MSVEHRASTLPGVRFGAVVRHADERGSFRELWRATQPGEAGEAGGPAAAATAATAAPAAAGSETFVQANLSTSATGVLRGLHLHRRQLDYWIVARGRAFVALVDVRGLLDGSARAPVVETRELGEDDWVVIPAGVAHGFLALEPLELLYLVTNWYDGSDELGFAWDDPAVAVPWPDTPGHPGGRPTTSERDASNPPLSELIARLRG